jgi:hypothetical protein
MKPGSQPHDCRQRGDSFRGRNSRRHPVTDCNYQTLSLDRYRGGSAGNSSFLNISREYFRTEARRNFIAETIFFLLIGVILAATFISSARAIIHFLHLPAA